MKKLNRFWGEINAKVDALALRERVLIFFAIAFLLVALVNMFFLDPLLAQQKKLSTQVVQQQEKMKDIQAQIANLLQAKKSDEDSPQRLRLAELRQEIEAGSTYLQGRRDRLVPPEKMAGLLEQVLKKNGDLQLVSLQTMPVAPLIDDVNNDTTVPPVQPLVVPDKQVFKHGVQITVRGSYLDLLQYLNALEHLPVQMFWGMAKMNVVQYPAAELTLTLYTLSLDKIWLQV